MNTCLNQGSYLEMGFTWYGDEFHPNPKCTVCREILLANEAMVPGKLMQHFSTKHITFHRAHQII
jgi:hypothetical protein